MASPNSPLDSQGSKRTNILSLPTELQSLILSHLPWYSHFCASLVHPSWCTLLQSPHLREKRYFPETYTAYGPIPEKEELRRRCFASSAIKTREAAKKLDESRYDEATFEGAGIHGLLCTDSLVLGLKPTGEITVYLVIQHTSKHWKGKEAGLEPGELTKPFETLAMQNHSRSMSMRGYHKLSEYDFSYHDITASPLLGTDSQFYYAPETEKSSQDKIRSFFMPVNGSTTTALPKPPNRPSFQILGTEYYTDGNRLDPRMRLDNDSDLEHEVVTPELILLPKSVNAFSCVGEVLRLISEALVDLDELEDDYGNRHKECWAIFESNPEEGVGTSRKRRRVYLTMLKLRGEWGWDDEDSEDDVWL